MGDSEDWFAAADDAPPHISSLKEENAPPPAGEGPTETPAPAAAEAEHEGDFLNTDKVLLFKHWKRPRFLPYKYLIDYRKNYYDDIIDYLDMRTRGIPRDIPVSQTWGERALRTYNKYSNRVESYRIKLEDKRLVEETRFSGKFHLQHAKNYINRRYSTFLY